MKIVITGASGTLGNQLKQYLEGEDIEVLGWNRAEVPVDNYAAMEGYLRRTQPTILFHLAVASEPTGIANEGWQVNYEWASELAWITRMLKIRFVFTSSIMVFTAANPGPYTISSVPDAISGYGLEKARAETRVKAQNPQAVVARLGWQIGEKAGSNNMFDFLEQQHQEHGAIVASRLWYPACSFLSDTARTLFRLSSAAPGLYLLDANERWSFYEIVSAIKAKHNTSWQINANYDFIYDQRMVDERVKMPSLKAHLPALD